MKVYASKSFILSKSNFRLSPVCDRHHQHEFTQQLKRDLHPFVAGVQRRHLGVLDQCTRIIVSLLFCLNVVVVGMQSRAKWVRPFLRQNARNYVTGCGRRWHLSAYFGASVNRHVRNYRWRHQPNTTRTLTDVHDRLSDSTRHTAKWPDSDDRWKEALIKRANSIGIIWQAKKRANDTTCSTSQMSCYLDVCIIMTLDWNRRPVIMNNVWVFQETSMKNIYLQM